MSDGFKYKIGEKTPLGTCIGHASKDDKERTRVYLIENPPHDSKWLTEAEIENPPKAATKGK